MRAACSFAELRHENDSSGHFLRIEITTQSLDGNGAFVLVSVRTAEYGDARRFRASLSRRPLMTVSGTSE